VTYLIEKKNAEVTKLTVLHDCSEAPLTAKHVSEDGWQWVLSNLKSCLETGQPLRQRAPEPLPARAPAARLPTCSVGRRRTAQHGTRSGVLAPFAHLGFDGAGEQLGMWRAWPRCSSIRAPLRAIARGLAFPCPRDVGSAAVHRLEQ